MSLKRISLTEEQEKKCLGYKKDKGNSLQEYGGKQAEFIVYNFFKDLYDVTPDQEPDTTNYTDKVKQSLKGYNILIKNKDLFLHGIVPIQVKSRHVESKAALEDCLGYRGIKYKVKKKDPIFENPEGLVAFVLRDDTGGYVTSLLSAKEVEKHKIDSPQAEAEGWWQLEVFNASYDMYLIDLFKSSILK